MPDHGDPRPRPRAGARARTGDQARAIVRELQRRIGAHKYDMWFSQTTMAVHDKRLEVRTVSPFVARRIDAGFGSTLRGIAQETLGLAADVSICVDGDAVREDGSAITTADDGHDPAIRRQRAAGKAKAPPDVAERRVLVHGRGPRLHDLNDFVVGPTNQMALSMCRRLADEPESSGVSPLFVHGECGVGKTHLLQGVCRRVMERRGSSLRVRYVTAEQFTNEFLAAIKAGNTESFRQRLRRLDVLAIDDVHFLAAKDKTQSEFQHTLDAIALSGARVVLASDHHPHHIQRFSQTLISRFMSGMVVKIERPDRPLRCRLIERMIARRGLRMTQPAVDELAARYPGSIRELEGAVTRIAACHELLGVQPNMDATLTNGHGPVTGTGEIGLLLVQQVLRDEHARPARLVRMASVIDAVCNRMGLSRGDLAGGSRHRKVVLGRSMTVYLARELTTHSYPEIAQALGRANHSTVHTADQRLRRQLQEDPPLEPGLAEPARTLRELAELLRRDACRIVS